LSEETLEKFIGKGYLHEFADLFKLDRYEEEIVKAKGFGRKSYDNLIEAANKARNVKLFSLIYSLGIPNIGLSGAKLLCKHFNNNLYEIRNAKADDFVAIDGIGVVMAKTIEDFFNNQHNNEILDNLLKEVIIEKSEDVKTEDTLEGLNFVITGAVHEFKNRDELKTYIESLGGKTTGSVTGKTNYLINNDVNSTSGKNKKAKELGVPIISEDDFLKMCGK
jgi:DNA ligase (NAD+)